MAEFIEVPAHPDIENHTTRVTQPGAWVSASANGTSPRAIVVHIPSFGNDATTGYATRFVDSVAAKLGIVAASVRYHCFDVRHDRVPPAMWKIASSNPTRLVYVPAEPMNFGVLQALDVLAVATRLRNLYPGIPLVAFGSSHGGYLALLAAKFCPGMFSDVFAASAYVRSVKNYMYCITDGSAPAYTGKAVIGVGGIRDCEVSVESAWGDGSSANLANIAIRSIGAVKEGWATGACQTNYILWHSPNDTMAPIEDSKRLVETFGRLGVCATLYVPQDSGPDGSVIRNLAHGMGLSLRGALETAWPAMRLSPTTPTPVRYILGDWVYEFAPTDIGVVGALWPGRTTAGRRMG